MKSKAYADGRPSRTFVASAGECAIGQTGVYFSKSQADWFAITVIKHDEDGGVRVRYPTGHERTISKEELAARDILKLDMATIWAPGKKVQYYSESSKNWYAGIVIGPDPEGGVKVNVTGVGEKTVPKDKLASNLKPVEDDPDDLQPAVTITDKPSVLISPRGEAPWEPKVGEKVKVWVPRLTAYVETTVDKVNPDKTVEVSLKGEGVDKITPDGKNIKPAEILDSKEVPEKAVPYYHTLQTALHPGPEGKSTLSKIMAQHRKKFGHTADGKHGFDKAGFIVFFKHLCKSLGLEPPQESGTAIGPAGKPDFPQGLMEQCYRKYVESQGGGYSATATLLLDPESGNARWYLRLIRMLVSSFKMLGGDDIKPKAVPKKNYANKYTDGKVLGRGAEGICGLCTEICSGITFVMKKPDAQDSVEDWDKVCDKSHPNIIRVFTFFTGPVHIVMETANGGDLFGAVDKFRENYPGEKKTPGGGVIGWATEHLSAAELWIAGVMYQAMAGVKYLHSKDQIHNDLKPENVLLSKNCPTFDVIPRVMIADFGCAVQADTVVLDSKGAVDHNHGDPRYQPPERIALMGTDRQGGAGNCKTDVWSLGVLLFELSSGGLMIHTDELNIKGWGAFKFHGRAPPYDEKNTSEVFKKFFSCMRPPKEPNWDQVTVGDDDCKTLLKLMLAVEEKNRTGSLSECMKSAWFNAFRSKTKEVPEDAIDTLFKRTELCSLAVAMLNLLVSKLMDETSMEGCLKIWNKYDDDASGTLDEKEFLGMLQSGCGMDSVAAMELCKIADMDGSGAVDYSEFVALMFDLNKLSNPDQHLKSFFFGLAAEEVVDAAAGNVEQVYLTQDDLANAFNLHSLKSVHETAKKLVPEFFKAMCAPENAEKRRLSFREFKAFIEQL